MLEDVWPPTGDKTLMYRIFAGKDTIGYVYHDKIYADGGCERYKDGQMEPTLIEWLIYEYIWRGEYEKGLVIAAGPIDPSQSSAFYAEARRLWR